MHNYKVNANRFKIRHINRTWPLKPNIKFLNFYC